MDEVFYKDFSTYNEITNSSCEMRFIVTSEVRDSSRSYPYKKENEPKHTSVAPGRDLVRATTIMASSG